MEVVAQERIVGVIKEKYEGEILRAEMLYDFLTITLKKEKIVEVIRHLYNHPQTEFKFLTTLCGIHYPDINQVAVMYQVHNMVSNERLRLKVYLPADKPTVDTLPDVFPPANWMERETYNFFGVPFEGHPNLIRILNVEDMIMFPLRKEFPLEDQVRQDKNDTMFGRN